MRSGLFGYKEQMVNFDTPRSMIRGISCQGSESIVQTKVKWLFLDLNSFFASVEQQDRPELRGKPIAVVPLESDHTCAIAASYEAKAYGVKTGTIIRDAKQLCPKLVIVPARHDIYVTYHHRIMEEIVRHTPLTRIESIDEMSSRLLPNRQNLAAAMALSYQIKAGLRENVGEAIRCSIGLADNAWLAKVATDMEKPDGLVALPTRGLPGRLFDLRLTDLPGIGKNMERRLNRAGLWTVEDLWNTAPKQLRAIWGSVEGEKMWHRLRGLDVPHTETSTSVVGHSRVLDPVLRDPDKALEVARRLTTKACGRMRRKGYMATWFSASAKGVLGGQTGRDIRLSETDDNITFIRILHQIWPLMMRDMHHQRLKKVSVTLSGLRERQLSTGDLFETAEMSAKPLHLALSHSMDQLNSKFGANTVFFGHNPKTQAGYLGTKIAFNRIPDTQEFYE